MASRKRYQTSEETRSDRHQEISQIITSAAEWIVESITSDEREGLTVPLRRPHNPLTGHVFSGGNAVLALMAMYTRGSADSRFMTFKQALAFGEKLGKRIHVRAGEKSLTFLRPIVINRDDDRDPFDSVSEARDTEARDTNEGSDRKFIGWMPYRVFHASQIEGLPPLREIQPMEFPIESMDHDLHIDRVIRLGTDFADAMGVQISHDESRAMRDNFLAYYDLQNDLVQMRPQDSKQYRNKGDYATTLIHELYHSTGHASREGRMEDTKFDLDEKYRYAVEEIRAEFFSLLANKAFSVDERLHESHKQYIDYYRALAKEKPNIVMRAAQEASATFYNLMDFAHGEKPSVDWISRGSKYPMFFNPPERDDEGLPVIDFPADWTGDVLVIGVIEKADEHGEVVIEKADEQDSRCTPHFWGIYARTDEDLWMHVIDIQDEATARELEMEIEASVDSLKRASKLRRAGTAGTHDEEERDMVGGQHADVAPAVETRHEVVPELSVAVAEIERAIEATYRWEDRAGGSDAKRLGRSAIEAIHVGDYDAAREALAEAIRIERGSAGIDYPTFEGAAGVFESEWDQRSAATQSTARPISVGDRVRFTPNEERAALGGMTIEGIVVDAARTQAGDIRYRIRTDEIAPQDGEPQEWLVYTNQGSIERLAPCEESPATAETGEPKTQPDQAQDLHALAEILVRRIEKHPTWIKWTPKPPNDRMRTSAEGMLTEVDMMDYRLEITRLTIDGLKDVTYRYLSDGDIEIMEDDPSISQDADQPNDAVNEASKTEFERTVDMLNENIRNGPAWVQWTPHRPSNRNKPIKGRLRALTMGYGEDCWLWIEEHHENGDRSSTRVFLSDGTPEIISDPRTIQVPHEISEDDLRATEDKLNRLIEEGRTRIKWTQYPSGEKPVPPIEGDLRSVLLVDQNDLRLQIDIEGDDGVPITKYRYLSEGEFVIMDNRLSDEFLSYEQMRASGMPEHLLELHEAVNMAAEVEMQEARQHHHQDESDNDDDLRSFGFS